MFYFVIKKFLDLNRTYKRVILVLTDTALITLCFLLAMWLRLDSLTFLFILKPWLTIIAVIPATIITFVKLGLYRAVIRYISSKALTSIGVGTLISANIMFLVSQLFSLQIPRSVPFIYFVILFLTISGIRLAFRQIYLLQKQNRFKPVAIYGAGEAGRQLLNALGQSWEYKPILFIDDNPQLDGVQISGLTVLPFRKASELIKSLRIKAILLTMPSVPVLVRNNIINQLERFPIEVKIMPGISELINSKTELSELREVSIEELLGRDPIPPMPELMGRNILNKTILITGAGGSIGAELGRQVIYQKPKELILLDVSEVALYKIMNKLEQICKQIEHEISLFPVVCSVQNKFAITKLLDTFTIQTIYHAAAYKHVPMMELNVVECLRNNVFGTKTLASAAVKSKVENFILISTDKAVRPSNIMGASKRMAELICQALATDNKNTRFSMVRFGNVLGSSGSVIPLFRKQIKNGGPITVTHKDITRYFMTIPEAAELVIQAGSMSKGGDLFVLDMGEPTKIIDLAKKMAHLSGLSPFTEGSDHLRKGTIAIKITGLRPGEKLYEELLIGKDQSGTHHPRIMKANEEGLKSSHLDKILEQLSLAIQSYDLDRISEIVLKTTTGFNPNSSQIDIIWNKKKENDAKPNQDFLKVIERKV